MGTPVVSVVIPAFNEEENIERTIASLCNQTMPVDEYEIVVVDNNSSDKTWEILSRLAVRVVKQTIQ